MTNNKLGVWVFPAILTCWGGFVLLKTWDGNRWVGGVPLAVGVIWYVGLLAYNVARSRR